MRIFLSKLKKYSTDSDYINYIISQFGLNDSMLKLIQLKTHPSKILDYKFFKLTHSY